MNHPELTQQALSILRYPGNYQWFVIPLLALVIYVYTNEISKKNWKGIAAGLSLYLVHWFYEIMNALIQLFVVSFLCYDWKPKVQCAVIGGLFVVDALMMIVFAGILKWI